MKSKLMFIFAVSLLSSLCLANEPTDKTVLIGDKNRGNFEDGLIKPWHRGHWCSSGKKPKTLEVGVTDDKKIVADSKYAMFVKMSGDADHKRISALIFSRFPIDVNKGAKLVLNCDLRNGTDGFQICGLQLFLLNKQGRYIGSAKVVKEQSHNVKLTQEKWVTATLTATIPDDKLKDVGYIQVRINLVCDNSDPTKVYESFIDNIKLIQQK